MKFLHPEDKGQRLLLELGVVPFTSRQCARGKGDRSLRSVRKYMRDYCTHPIYRGVRSHIHRQGRIIVGQQLTGGQLILRALEGFDAFLGPVPLLVSLEQGVQRVKNSREVGYEFPIIVQ